MLPIPNLKSIPRTCLAAIAAACLVVAGGCAGHTRDRGATARSRATGTVRVYFDPGQSLLPPNARLQVYRAFQPGGPFAPVATRPLPVPEPSRGAGLLITDSGLPLDAEVFYYIAAVSPAGGERKITRVARARAVLPDSALPRSSSKGPS